MDQQIHQRCQQLEQDLSDADAMHERAQLDKQELCLMTEKAEEAARALIAIMEKMQSIENDKLSSARRLYALPPSRVTQQQLGKQVVLQAIVLK